MKNQCYILRLDDASDYMNIENWNRMETLLDHFNIKPIFGIIPCNRDKVFVSDYKKNEFFWDWVHECIKKDWLPAMHGYEHVYDTKEGGINPVNPFSEFAGHSLEEQKKRIRNGYSILKDKGVEPGIFFAPGHTFDGNTLKALRDETPIRIVSDTIAWDVYQRFGFTFIPQQCGNVRKLPFKVCTFTYHPNTMSDRDFETLESFLNKNFRYFSSVGEVTGRIRRRKAIDCIMEKLYFAFRKVRKMIKRSNHTNNPEMG